MPIDRIQSFNKNKTKKETIMKRSKMSRHSSKKTFRKGMKTQRKNLQPAPQRGGYRL